MSGNAPNLWVVHEQNVNKAGDEGGANATGSLHHLRKYKGVYPAGRKFRAVMQLDGVRHNLGMYETNLEAARAYDKFARDHNKKANFPSPSRQHYEVHAPSTSLAFPQTHTTTLGFNGSGSSIRNINSSSRFAAESITACDRVSDFPLAAHAANGEPDSSSADNKEGARLSLSRSSDHTCSENGLSWGVATQKERDDHKSRIVTHDRTHEPPTLTQHPHLMFHQQLQQPDWQEFYFQHKQRVLLTQMHDQYSTQNNALPLQMAPIAHPVVYIPVPLPISDAVAKYISEFQAFEQQRQTMPYALSSSYGATERLFESPWLNPPEDNLRNLNDDVPFAASQDVVEQRDFKECAAQGQEVVIEKGCDPQLRKVRDFRQADASDGSESDREAGSDTASESAPKTKRLRPTSCNIVSASPITQPVPLPCSEVSSSEQHCRLMPPTEDALVAQEQTLIVREELECSVAADQTSTALVLKNKKRTRKSRRKAAVAEEAQRALNHPAARYITTIGRNPTDPIGLISQVNVSAVPMHVPVGSTSEEMLSPLVVEAEAWRQQVRYHWRGTLVFDPSRCMQVWQGAWLGTKRGTAGATASGMAGSDGNDEADDLPSLEGFQATETTFEYLSAKVRKSAEPQQQLAGSKVALPQSGYFKGYYKMRSTKVNCYVKHHDRNFYVIFVPCLATGPDGLVHEYALYGRGVGEYGAFIVQGSFNNQTGIMQAVRIFLRENDTRAWMSLKQLQAWFQQGGRI